MIKKLICHHCGSVNLLDTQQLEADVNQENDDWLECSEPDDFQWRLPAGKITPVVGDPIYITGGGLKLTRGQYIEQYGIDPEIALTMMRGMGRAVKATLNTAAEISKTDSRIPGSIRKLMEKFSRTKGDP